MSTNPARPPHSFSPATSAAGSSSRTGRHLWRAANYLVMVGIAALMVTPFVAMISVSFQQGVQAALFPITWIPIPPILTNYEALLSSSLIGRWYLNSLIVAGVGTLIVVFTATTAAYAFARMDFPLRSTLFWSFLAMLMVPNEVTLIPLYILLSRIGWVNTYQALIVPGITSAFGIFLIRQYLLSLPADFEDSARLDGASEFQIYWQIVMPMLTPVVATLVTIQFLAYWNEFLYPLVVTSRVEMRTLPVGLATLQNPVLGIPGQLAGATLATIPTIVVFMFFQRYFVRGISMSGLKG